MTDKTVVGSSNPMHRLEELAIPNGAVVQASFTKAEAQQLLAVLRAAPETDDVPECTCRTVSDADGQRIYVDGCKAHALKANEGQS